MNLTIFSSSTGFRAYKTMNEAGGLSYIDRLWPYYYPRGIWNDGLSILHVRRFIFEHLRGNDKWFILHMGAVEALSHPAANYMEWCVRYLAYMGMDEGFSCFILPKMLKAAHSLSHKEEAFYKILEPQEFQVIFDFIMQYIMPGSKVIVIGMSKPNDPSKPHWLPQAMVYNNLIEETANQYNAYFINILDKYAPYVVDSNHMTEEGHNLLFEEIMNILNKE